MRTLLIMVLLMSLSNIALAKQNYTYQNDNNLQNTNTQNYNENYKLENNTLKGRVVAVPAGQSFKAMVTTPLSSSSAVEGQGVSLTLSSDFIYNNNIIAPTGSIVNGTVIAASGAKHASLNGKLSVRFTQIITPNGQNIPISAVIRTNDNTGVLVGGTKADVAKDYAKDIAVGAGVGALAGVIISPLAGGSIGRGTALATAVGAGSGLVKSVWDTGEDVTIPSNSTVDLILTQPITVTPLNTNNSLYGQ